MPNIQSNKFTPDPLPRVCVTRKHLQARISKAADKRLIFVIAPAGSGKTVSALQWMHASGRKPIWIGLDAYDNSVSVFYRMLCTGILSAQPDNGRMTTILQNPAFDSSPVEHTIRLLAEFEPNGNEYALALDDFHTITNDEILKSFPFILRRMPHLFVTLVLSRNLPRETFSELLDKSNATIIGAPQLAFTKDEIISYCKLLGKTITPEQAEAALSDTGGWAIGINAFSQSAAFADAATAPYRQPDSDIKPGSGTNRKTLEQYIQVNLWNQWDLSLRRFMTISAVLDEMPAGLCAKITGRADAGELLETLREQNAFVTRIADGIYRYHHLFLDFLRAQPEYELFDKKKAFVTAAEYYLSEEKPLIARRYAIESGDVKTIANAQYAFTNSKGHSIDEYVNIVQNLLKSEAILELCEKSPTLYITYAYLSWLTGDSGSFEKYTDDLRRNLPKIALKYPQFLESTYAIIALDYRTTFEKLIRQVSRLPLIRFPGDEMRSSSLSMQMPFLHRSTRDYHELTDEKLYPGLKKTFGKLLKSHYELIMHATRSGLYLEQDRTTEALSESVAALALLTPATVGEIRFAANMHHAAICYALGQIDEFDARVEETERFVNEDAQFLRPNFLAFKARVALWDGDTDAAALWLGNYFVHESATLVLYRLYQYFTTVRAYAVRGDYAKAKDLAQRLRQLGKDFNRLQDTAEAGTLLAAVLHAEGKTGKAQEMMEVVLLEMQRHGFIRLIADEGTAVVPLLKRVLKKVRNPDYTGSLDPVYVNKVYIAAVTVSKTRHGIITSLGGRPVKLSKRQQTILELYAQGYRRENLSEKTGLSINTIKTHTRLLYEKLGVSNSADAVAKAHELRLI